LLAKTGANESTAGRIEFFSRHFLGLPYTTNPLIGSAGQPEVFVVSLSGFCCVTYIETVLALARAATPDDFVKELRKIRYEGGRVDWSKRNHYMSGWIRNNAREGAVRRVAAGRRVSKRRLLNVVPDLPAAWSRFECIPKREIERGGGPLQTGDLIFFASTRPHLDVFHCGIVIRDGSRLFLRHASRSRNGVVEQELNEFLKANRMAGILAARPQDSRKKPRNA
jgi:hypothetical protein